jgi:hypothetical protein
MVLTVATILALVGMPGSVHASADDGPWTHQFGTNGLDEAKSVAVDGAGAIYVAGETFGTLPGQTPGGTLDAFVRKYDPAGRELWTRQFGAWERDIAWGVAVDRLGLVYVVGQTEGALPDQHSAGGWDAFIRKYDSSGTELWTRQFGGGGADVASGVAVDPAGAVYVAGTTSSTLPGQVNAGSFDAFVRRYDGDGREVWTRQFGTPAGDNARRVAIDPAGRVVVVGSTEGAFPGQVSAGGFDAFISMFDSEGHQLWIRQFGSAGDDFGVSLAIGPTGSISVAGSADRALPGQTSPGGTTAFLRQFDVAGTVLWTDQFGTGAVDDAWDVAVDAVRKYDRDGNEAWTHQYGTPEDDYALAVALNAHGMVVAGSTRGTLADHAAGDLDAYVMQLTTAGTR